MKIEFSEQIRTTMLQLDPKDLIKFIESVTGNYELKSYERIYVNEMEEQPEEKGSRMTNIIFNFQAWKKKESGSGTKYKWKNYRAIGFACMNIQLCKITI
jgi:hypothetical protein